MVVGDSDCYELCDVALNHIGNPFIRLSNGVVNKSPKLLRYKHIGLHEQREVLKRFDLTTQTAKLFTLRLCLLSRSNGAFYLRKH